MLNFPTAPILGQEFTGGGSSWTWDGVKWEGTSNSSPVITVAPASGATVTMVGSRLYVNNPTTLAALTIRLPPPVPLAEISFRSSVTVLTIQRNDGATITGTPTSAYGPGAALFFCYVDNTIGWCYWK